MEWLEELTRRVRAIREEVAVNVENAQLVRKERHDVRAVERRFKVGNKVLTRVPGLSSKLESSWEGPFVVLDVPSEYHVVLGNPRKSSKKSRGKRVHVNSCKLFVEASTHMVAVWATEDSQLEPLPKLVGEELTATQELELGAVVQKWNRVLSDTPGVTHFLEHDICMRDAPPTRSVPYVVLLKWQEAVKICSSS